MASCAVPLLFHPVRIGGRFFFDGGVFHKSGLNLEHPDERTLCVFLLNDGIADAYEWGRSLGRLGKHQKVLCFRNLPQVTPDSLDKGLLANAEAALRTREALRTGPVDSVF